MVVNAVLQAVVVAQLVVDEAASTSEKLGSLVPGEKRRRQNELIG